MRILLTGGTGLVGSKIAERLISRGDDVVILSRSEKAKGTISPSASLVVGDPTQPGPWLEQLNSCDAVIHLAGESIGGGRWTVDFKKRILESRVLSTTLIANQLAKHPNRIDGTPKVLVSTSAIGFYGAFVDNSTEFIESDLPGSGFLADVCVQWERSTEAARLAGVRVPIIRVGVVLASHGGALQQMVTPFKFFMGGPIGSGKQWLSWIHIDDLVSLFVLALDHPEARGPINGTAPEPVTNWGFSKTLGSVLVRPSWFPTPAFALSLLLGEMAVLATHGQRVIPTRAKSLGFDFQYPLLEKALRHVLNKPVADHQQS